MQVRTVKVGYTLAGGGQVCEVKAISTWSC